MQKTGVLLRMEREHAASAVECWTCVSYTRTRRWWCVRYTAATTRARARHSPGSRIMVQTAAKRSRLSGSPLVTATLTLTLLSLVDQVSTIELIRDASCPLGQRVRNSCARETERGETRSEIGQRCISHPPYKSCSMSPRSGPRVLDQYTPVYRRSVFVTRT